jgi:hypothetical protein
MFNIVRNNNAVLVTRRNRYGKDKDKTFVFDNERIAERVAMACKEEVKLVGEISLPLLRNQLQKAKIGYSEQ